MLVPKWLLALATTACTVSPLRHVGAVPTAVGDTFAVTQVSSQTSCTVEVLGCFYDKKWGDCRYLHTPKPGCTGAAKGGRDIPFAPEGCFPACNPDQHECQHAPSPPPCDPKTIDLEECATICANWQFPGANNYEVYAAMQAGFVCFCGTSADGAAATQTTEETEVPVSDCNAGCPGNALENCGAAGRNSIMRVSCASAWGVGFLSMFGAVTLLYVAGGVGFTAKSQGKAVALASHPHYPQWQEVRGLVMDGVKYARVGHKTGAHRGGARRPTVASKYGAVEQEEHSRERKKQRKRTSDRPEDVVPDSKSRKSRQKGTKPDRQTDEDAAESSRATESSTAHPQQQTAAGGGGRWVHVPT
eukprot:COSAG02_NODE_3558_length_6563_cov_38.861850_2_plen_359_part_00